MKEPKWTVLTNLNSKGSDWVGTSWEFFDTEEAAQSCFDSERQKGNVPTMRPYFRDVDAAHLGAVHRIPDVQPDVQIQDEIERQGLDGIHPTSVSLG